MRRFTMLVCALWLLLGPAPRAQQYAGSRMADATVGIAPDVPEPGSVDAIARFTTDTRFVSPWVAYVPDSKGVPSPTRFLGHLVGAPGELSKTTQIDGYLRALAKASPRVRV